VVGEVREKELLCAAETLGVREVAFLDYLDGDLDKADPPEAVAKIVSHIRRIRPDVIVSFGPEGAYGHPDHIAISQFAGAAIVAAADPGFSSNGGDPEHGSPHSVSKFYYMVWPPDKWAAYQSAFRDLKTTIDGVERRATPWPDWVITTLLDTSDDWTTAWEAINCHKTQLTIYSKLKDLPEEHHRALWGKQEFYRVFSLVNGGRQRETDLFAGLR
jgi:LmbE family N-acetylglucosaminyl deacetylase